MFWNLDRFDIDAPICQFLRIIFDLLGNLFTLGQANVHINISGDVNAALLGQLASRVNIARGFQHGFGALITRK